MAAFGVRLGVRTRRASFLVLLVVVVLSGCAGGDGDVVAGEPRAAAPPAVDATAQFSLWLSADRIPPGPVEVVAVLVNHVRTDATFGVGATVDRWEDGAWAPHRQLVMCMDHWYCTARMQDTGGELEMPTLGLSAAVGQPGPVERFTTDGLDVGWYRISQEANEGVVAAGIIEVAEDAPAPAPLAAVDEPAISVQPPLVTPDGGAVTLTPLIPPVAGSQSIKDVQAGVRGLPESAAVERWETGSWLPVADIEFEAAPSPPDFGREIALPPLPIGEYRLIRAGPDATHVGHFWVTDTAAPTAEAADDSPQSEAITEGGDGTTTPPEGAGNGNVGALSDLEVVLELDDTTLTPGESTGGELVIENPTTNTIVDRSCALVSIEFGLVPADQPGAPLSGAVEVECEPGGSSITPGATIRSDASAAFTASEPGDYLAIVRHHYQGSRPLIVPVTVSVD